MTHKYLIFLSSYSCTELQHAPPTLKIGRPLIYHLQYNYSQKLHLLILITNKNKVRWLCFSIWNCNTNTMQPDFTLQTRDPRHFLGMWTLSILTSKIFSKIIRLLLELLVYTYTLSSISSMTRTSSTNFRIHSTSSTNWL